MSSEAYACYTAILTSAGAAMQMVEELTMAVLMSVGFAVPVFYACQMQGSFFVFWLSWLISLADGIGESSRRAIIIFLLLMCMQLLTAIPSHLDFTAICMTC